MPRYRVTGLPPAAANGATAFTPHFNRLAGSGAMEYKAQVEGQPGTEGRAVDMVQRAPAGTPTAIATMGTARSSDAPDMFYPNQYYAYPEPGYWPGAGMPVQMYNPVRPQDTTMIPVPANRIFYRSQQGLDGAVIQEAGGPGAIKQAFALMRWAQRVPGQGNG